MECRTMECRTGRSRIKKIRIEPVSYTQLLDDAFFADHALVRTRDAVIDLSFICYAAAVVNFYHAFALGRGGRLADQILHAVDLLQKGFVGKILVDEPAAMEQIVIFLRETALVPQRLGSLGIVVVFEDQGFRDLQRQKCPLRLRRVVCLLYTSNWR